MRNYKYVIVGGGMAADAAAKSIRKRDQNGSIAVISGESHPPYKRPPLSKQLWKGKLMESIWLKTADSAVDVLLGLHVYDIDPEHKFVIDSAGSEYKYEKLLLAVGGTPRRLAFGHEHVIYYRYLEDYNRLSALAETGDSFVVIGGGFVGSEIGAALSMNGKLVTMVFSDAAICGKAFPAKLSQHIDSYYQTKGVRLLPGDAPVDVGYDKGKLVVTTKNGESLCADGVIAGIGIEPCITLATAAGIQTDNGIVVDANLQSSVPDIYAAGDVANFYSTALGKRVRVEHEDNAKAMGKLAGANMAGDNQVYDYVPFFYSDLFELGYEAVGELDSRLETVEDWEEEFKKGVVYYMREGRVCGALLWNVWDKTDAGREIMSRPGPVDPESLIGAIR